MTPGRWVANNLKVADIAINTGPLCSEKVETLSRRAGRARYEGKRWGCVFCAILNPVARAVCRALGMRVPEDHCEEARLAPEIE